MRKDSKYPEHEQYRRKAQRKLEGLDYTPQAARFLSGVLLSLRDDCLPAKRESILGFFATCANGKLQ